MFTVMEKKGVIEYTVILSDEEICMLVSEDDFEPYILISAIVDKTMSHLDDIGKIYDDENTIFCFKTKGDGLLTVCIDNEKWLNCDFTYIVFRKKQGDAYEYCAGTDDLSLYGITEELKCYYKKG